MSALSQTTTGAAIAPMTAEIVNEFVQLIDNNKDYQLRELKTLLSSVYKTKTSKPKTPKSPKADKSPNVVSDVSSEDDEDKPRKRGRPAKVSKRPSREPTAYNKYVKQRIEALKLEKPDIIAKELMKLAAADWKNLTKEEQEAYK
jgi:hypothetical protein